MFAIYSNLKNLHKNEFYFKCRLCVSNRRNHSQWSRYPTVVFKRSAASPKKCYYEYFLLKKSRINHYEILSRYLSTGSRLRNGKDEMSKSNSPKEDGERKIRFLQPLFYVLLSGLLHFGLTLVSEAIRYISWEEFKREILAVGEVKSIVVSLADNIVEVTVQEDAVIKNLKYKLNKYFIKIPNVRKFEEKLQEAEEELGISATDRVPVSYVSHELEQWRFSLQAFLAEFYIFFFLCNGKRIMGIFSSLNSVVSLRKYKRYTIVDPLMGDGKGVKFSDVAGLKEAKREIMDFVDYLKRPDVYRKLGAKVPKGALLLGPPGCGKTLLAKAVATEAMVPFLSMNGSEFMEIIGGLGAARVRILFEDAKNRIPCIIYIDEIDAIGKKRLGMGNREAEQTLNQLLVEMDGLISNEGITVLASTNRAEVLDSALLRPGRFDRHILIDFPTYQERQEIFEQHLKGLQLEHKSEEYSKRMAHLTPGFSGADIANICNEAALHAARFKKKFVQAEDLEYALERVVGGTEKRSSARTPEETRLFAYYEAGRALVGWLSKYGEALLKVTIVARTSTPAGWTHFSPKENFLYSTEDLKGKMCMGLGGRAAVMLLFNRITTAGKKDLEKVTKLAYAQVRVFGMNETIGLMSFDLSDSENTQKKPYSKVLGNLFDQEAQRLVTEAYKEAEKILLDNKDKLIKLAEELLVKETLNYEDVVNLIGPPAFEGKKLIEPLEFTHSLDQAVGPEPEPEPVPENRNEGKKGENENQFRS